MFIVKTNTSDEFEFYVGTSKPNVSPEEVIKLQADGHEMRKIIDNFNNIIYNQKSRSLTLYGDIAKIVFANL